MSAFSQILFIGAGLLLFLFGMVKLSTVMQRVFSVRIRQYIKYLVKKPLSGIGIGAIITAIFQSSLASMILFIGMVNAGLISFFNSLSLVLGGIIGSTITVQLVVFKITTISPLFIIIGLLLWFFARGKLKLIGGAIFYFGLIFFGLNLMSQGLDIFKESEGLLQLIQGSKNLLLGIVVGFIFTAVIQSSAATISILVLLAQQGLIGIESAIPIVLGANIGTTITEMLASIGTNKNAKRTAFSHFFFKFFGVLIVLPFLPIFISFLRSSIHSVAQQIALGHILLSIIIVLVFAFLLKPFASFMRKIIPGEEKVLPLWPEWLDKRYLSNSKKAFEATAKELEREMMLAQKNYQDGVKLISEFNKSAVKSIFYIDLVIDNLQKEIMVYLDGISRLQLSKNETKKLFSYAAMVDDIERIGDHVTNIAHLAEYKKQGRAHFSKDAEKEVERIQNLVAENIEDARLLILNKSEQRIKAIFEREKIVDELVKQARENHLERFYKGICLAMAGAIFIDLLVNLERISDHCMNIAEYVEQL